MKGHQSWITYASNDREGLKTLILVRSLRRSITTRNVTVFVSYLVSDEMWERLEKEFDRCIRINKKQLEQEPELCFRDVAKSKCWKLTKLNKFVFLDCNCLVILNSDELFKQGSLKNFHQKDESQLSVLVGSPSEETFEEYAENAESSADYKNFEMDYNDRKLLDRKYNVPINLQGNNVKVNIHEMRIVLFKEVHPIDILSQLNNDAKNVLPKQGSLEQAIFDMWMDLLDFDNLGREITDIFSLSRQVIKNVEGLQKPQRLCADFKHLEPLTNSIAIVGMGLRFPGSNNLEEFWDLLINGKDGIVKVPDERWTEEQCFNRTDNTKATQAGFLKCPIDEIDAKFFGLSPMEVSYMDPQQRLTLQVMWEAFENAGINPIALKNSQTGVFGGWWRNDYKEMLQESGLNEQEFFRTYMGNSLGTLTSRISHVLELTGPSISTESGCSTSIVAVDMACKSLLNEDCDVGLAFGVNLLLHPFSIHTMNSVIAVDGHCKTFDAKADGFGRAEGCAVLILKRFSDAVRDGDRIWSLIRGSAVVQEGPSRSLGTPTVQCESLAMELALEDAGVKPKDVSFVETHGTGTPVGDPLEVAAVAEVYSKGRQNNLVIGSVKTNIGHTEACSGIAGIIKTVLAIQNEIIPPHRNFESLNPDVKLHAVPAEIPMSPYIWKKNHNGQPRIAGVSSFGITGTDAHVIIQETPDVPRPNISTSFIHPCHNILKLSAKSSEALDDLLVSYKDMLSVTKENILDISYTANVGRGDFPHRSIIVGYNKTEILEKLQRNLVEKSNVAVETPKICFLFTGQGSQYPGMAKDLYEQSATFKIHFDNCNSILETDYNINIMEAMWGTKTEDLSRTIYSQTSIFCMEYCLLKLWESWGVKPEFVLGHSLGEFAAAVAAGILSFEDAIKLVAERSILIDSLSCGKMLVLKESQPTVDLLLKQAFNGTSKWLDFAAINSPEQTVLAGSEENVSDFVKFCSNNQVKTHILDASHAFHSRLMDPILEKYRQVATTIKYNKPHCTFVSGMEGKIMDDTFIDADYWVRHTREPVRFASATQAILQRDCNLFLEIGPQPVLSALMLINADSLNLTSPITCIPSLRRNTDEWSILLTSLGKLYMTGVDVNWHNFYRFSQAKKVTLPFYPFQNKSYWFDVKGNRQQQIHALVGTPVSNPSQMKIFQNQLSLYSLPYLIDHSIGNTIVFPGAGFLEMCLVSGHAAYQCLEGNYTPPGAPISIKDFVIEGPLALYQTQNTQLQVVVSTEDAGDTRITIYSKLTLDKETHKWIRHSSAIFSPYAVAGHKEELHKNDTLEDIKARCTEKELFMKTYDTFSDFGLKFGPAFKTLQNIGWKGKNEIYVEGTSEEDILHGYVLHPVVIDAMFQAIVITSNPDGTQLQVPVSVTNFIWYAHLKNKDKFIIHVRKEEGGEYQAVLYDSNGQRIALMIGATFLETNVSTVLSAIEAQRTSLPSMYEEVWRRQSGPLDKRILEMPQFEDVFSDERKQATIKYNNVDPDGQLYYEKVNLLCLNYILKALLDLKWNPDVGQHFTCKNLLVLLKIEAKFEPFLSYLLGELANEGFIEIESWERNHMDLKVVKKLPSKEKVLNELESLYVELDAKTNIEVDCMAATGKVLAEILSGKQSALPILFPEHLTDTGYAEMYFLHSNATKNSSLVGNQEILPFMMKYFKNPLNEDKKVLRILEVGAGTGTFTKAFLPFMDCHASGYEYTYTDISSVFFPKGEKVFENSKIKVIYKTLDIEQDPHEQGFIPHNYDMVFASYVIHATKDIRNSVTNLRNLLRPGGLLILTELTKSFRGCNIIFGCLEGFWRFTDFDLRPHNCEISASKWEDVLRELDFVKTASFDSYLSHCSSIVAKASESTDYISQYLPIKHQKTWFLFSDDDITSKFFFKKLTDMGKNVVVIKSTQKGLERNGVCKIRLDEPSDMKTFFHEMVPKSSKELEGIIYLWGLEHADKEYESICRPFLTLCKTILTFDHTKVFVYTRGSLSIEDHEMVTPSSSPLFGMTKALQNENPSLVCRCIDLEPRCSITEAMLEGFGELFINDSEIVVAYRANQRQICRLVSYKVSNTALHFPKSECSKLILPSSNAIPDLRFGASVRAALAINEVEICVKAYSLNFRDIFAVLKPDAMFENVNTVGLDYSGIITAIGSNVQRYQVGDEVFGINLNGDALPSYIKAGEDLVARLPKNMTFCEAATLPAVVATAYKCLSTVAKLKKHENILIHTGSGGVGLCAIQLAKSLNCNIITTAGSARKRSYLRNLGIKHVFHSRNTDYEKQIKDVLGGAEVDVVLNSLTGPGFKEASLNVCKPGARFIEMSKLNTWTKEDVQALRPDVFYEQVDVSSSSETEIKEFMDVIEKFIDTKAVKPIPYVRFDACEVREALNYMQRAKHIGKVVCVMPEMGTHNRNSDPKGNLFNNRSTYLITGGLGGIGLEVAKWMAESGARHLVLAGRSLPNEKATELLTTLNLSGIHAIAVQCDVGDFEQCQKLLTSLRSKDMNLPTLRGIMHSAGVLSDGLFEIQTWDKYQDTFNAKVKGGWNLHKLTLDYPLEHFVMFSSAVANFGSLGQSNHCAANVFMDSLASYRNSIGLPAISVNWGQWGQVGIAANLDVIGLKPITPFQGTSALERVMTAQKVRLCVLEANFFFLRNTFPAAKKYLSEFRDHQNDNVEYQASSEDFWKDYDSAEDVEKKYEIVKKYLRLVIRKVLKLEDNDIIDDHANLQDIGMDSLMMIEMKNVLQALVGKRASITVNSVKDCHTVAQLATRIVDLVSGVESFLPPTREELNLLIRDDAKLPPHIQPQGKACKPSEIRTVLVTGATGNLGTYILKELSRRPYIQKVYCLMRGSKKDTAKHRLLKTIKDKNLLSQIRIETLEYVEGNVSQAKFGLSDVEYTNLTQEVDAVFHLAVLPTWQDTYRKASPSDSDIRTVNVGGMKNILEFACSAKSKHVFHAGASLAVSKVSEDGRLSEDWPDYGDFDTLPNDAYPISKFICDLLISQAVERGLPCKVFRFPFIGGDSKTGSNISSMNNALMLRMMSYMHLGIMPAYCIPFFIVPVDTCADISTRIFFNDAAGNEVYNVSNPHVNDEQELEDIAEGLGHSVEIVEPDEFIERLSTMEVTELLIFVKKGAENKVARANLEKNVPEVVLSWMANRESDIFLSKKLEQLIPEYPTCMEPSLSILKRDLQYSKTSGIFSKLGLKSTLKE